MPKVKSKKVMQKKEGKPQKKSSAMPFEKKNSKKGNGKSAKKR